MFELFFACAILSACWPAHTVEPQADSVVIFRADFEGSEDTNYDHWPDGWTRRRGKGYPPYNPVEIVADKESAETENAASQRSLEFRMDGGGVQVFAPPVPVRPQFSYLLEAKLRTEKLRNNDVVFSVTFYDANDTVVATHESEPIQRADQWQSVRVGPISCPDGNAAHRAIISAHVRPGSQPDLAGRIYVDDVRFSRLPRMSVELNRDFGIYLDCNDVLVTCRVSGFNQPSPVITFELLDVDRKPLNVTKLNVSGSDAAPRSRVRTGPSPAPTELGFAGSVSWKPPVPEFGYYHVKVSTPEHCGIEKSIVVAPPTERSKKTEFGWTLPEGEKSLSIRLLPTLLGHAGVHWVKFPVWFKASDSKRAEELAAFAERLDLADMELVGLLDQPPRDVRDAFGMSGRIASASIFEDKTIWQPAVDHVMTRLSLKVEWWQLGRDDDTSFSSYADVNAKMGEICDDLATFGKKVHVGIPWRVVEEIPSPTQPSWSFLSYFDPASLTDTEIRSYLEPRAAIAGERWIVLQPLDDRQYDVSTRASDLVRRMVAAKIARMDGIFIPDALNQHQGIMNPDGSPSELFLPWRTTATLIGGRDYRGAIKTPGRSEAHVFASGNEAVVAVWNTSPTIETLFLGEQLEVHDIWGRSCSLEQRTNSGQKNHEIAVGPTPIFITGVNSAIATWCMQFQIETENLANEFGREQLIAYRFENPFPTGVSGVMTIHTPDVWRTANTSRQFKLAAGEEMRDQLRVVLGPDANTGPQPIRVDFELSGENDLQFSVTDSIEVGLGDIVVELDTRLDDHGNLIVEQHLLNNVEKPVSFNCMLFAPNRRRDKRQVFNIHRGRTTNVFVLPNGHELLGKTLWVRAEEIGGTRVLNDRIIAHE